MQRWRGDASGRRRYWLAWALLVLTHVALVATMLRSRVAHERPADKPALEATILLRPAPAPRTVAPGE